MMLMDVNARLTARKRWTIFTRVASMLSIVAFFALGVFLIEKRMLMGQTSNELISSFNAQDLLKYKELLHLPINPSVTINANLSDYDGHTNQAFVSHYGGWATGIGELLENHCDMNHINMVMGKNTDTTYCGPGSSNSLGCVAGFYRDKTTTPPPAHAFNANAAPGHHANSTPPSSTSLTDSASGDDDGRSSAGSGGGVSNGVGDLPGAVQACPDGFFCPSGQVCYVICALGGACNASKPVSEKDPNSGGGGGPHSSHPTSKYAKQINPPKAPTAVLFPRFLSFFSIEGSVARKQRAGDDDDWRQDDSVLRGGNGWLPTPPRQSVDFFGGAEGSDGGGSHASAVKGGGGGLWGHAPLETAAAARGAAEGVGGGGGAGGSGGAGSGLSVSGGEYVSCVDEVAKRSQPLSAFLPSCPGAKYLSLCPARYYCPNPVEMHECPKGFYCPTGSPEPIKCFKFLHDCDVTMLQTPQDNHLAIAATAFALLLLYALIDIEQRPRSQSKPSPSTPSRRRQDPATAGAAAAGSAMSAMSSSFSSLSSFGSLFDESDEEDGEVKGGERGGGGGGEGGEGGGGRGGDRERCLFGSVAEADPAMDVAFRGLGLKLHGSNAQVLRGVSGEFKRGRVAAIMGPSGVGKTTFLNTLCGRAPYGTTSGYVTINQHDNDRVASSGSVGTAGDDEGAAAGAGEGGGTLSSSTPLKGVKNTTNRRSTKKGSSSVGLPHQTTTRGGGGFDNDSGGGGGSSGSENDPEKATAKAVKGGGKHRRRCDNLQHYTHLVGLVPQDDVMHGWLTVQENLWLYARLKHRRHSRTAAYTAATAEEVGGNNTWCSRRKYTRDGINAAIHFKVKNLMKVLGLYHVRHSIIGDDKRRGISGGQRKRVNVGMELVLDPSVLFLDEPTTGLDSTTSLELVHALRSVAEHRHLTIAAVVHQPSAKIFNLFHDVLLLGEGGATVYLGPTCEALSYFDQLGFHLPPMENPADFFLDVISAKVPVITSTMSTTSTVTATDPNNQALLPYIAAAAASERAEEEEEEEEDAVKAVGASNGDVFLLSRFTPAHSARPSSPTSSASPSFSPSMALNSTRSISHSPHPHPSLDQSNDRARTMSQQESGSKQAYRWTKEFFNPSALAEAWEMARLGETDAVDADGGAGVSGGGSVGGGSGGGVSSNDSPSRQDFNQAEEEEGQVEASVPPFSSATPNSPRHRRHSGRRGGGGGGGRGGFAVYGSVPLTEVDDDNGGNAASAALQSSASSLLSASSASSSWRQRAALAQTYLPPWLSVFRVFCARACIEHMRFPFESLYEIMLELVTGFVVGALYTNFEFHDLQQMNFMMSLAVGFTLALGSMRVFGPGMLVFWREAAPGTGMGLSKSAFFVSKCAVELPRMMVLVLALDSAFYPLASPRCPFALHFFVCLSAAWAVTGWAFVLSVAQDPKSAQLSVVVILVLFAMFCGVAPRLPVLEGMGPPARLMSWLSYARWFIECLYTEETIRMSDAWRMPPAFYGKPGQESALLGLQSMAYVERSTVWNVGLLMFQGFALRLAAFACLGFCNRDKMGLAPCVTFSRFFPRKAFEDCSRLYLQGNRFVCGCWGGAPATTTAAAATPATPASGRSRSVVTRAAFSLEPEQEPQGLPPAAVRVGTVFYGQAGPQAPSLASLMDARKKDRGAEKKKHGERKSGRAISVALLRHLGMQEESDESENDGDADKGGVELLP